MDGLKCFAASGYENGNFGVQCGIVFARDIDEALRLFKDSEDLYFVTEDDLEEIPIEPGYVYIGGYYE